MKSKDLIPQEDGTITDHELSRFINLFIEEKSEGRVSTFAAEMFRLGQKHPLPSQPCEGREVLTGKLRAFIGDCIFEKNPSLTGMVKGVNLLLDEWLSRTTLPVQGEGLKDEYDTIPAQFVGDKSRKIKRVTATKYPKEKYFAVEYAGFWDIQEGQYYGDTNILDAEKVGEDVAESNAKLIAKLLNAHYNSSPLPPIADILCPNCGCNKFRTDASEPNECVNCKTKF